MALPMFHDCGRVPLSGAIVEQRRDNVSAVPAAGRCCAAIMVCNRMRILKRIMNLEVRDRILDTIAWCKR